MTESREQFRARIGEVAFIAYRDTVRGTVSQKALNAVAVAVYAAALRDVLGTIGQTTSLAVWTTKDIVDEIYAHAASLGIALDDAP